MSIHGCCGVSVGRCALRVLSLACLVSGTASAQVVVNEIDYDQPGIDGAEFIELRNNGGGPVDLSSLSIELVNGNGGGATIYQTIPLPGVVLAAGGYFVVCANPSTVVPCDLDVSPDTNLIQNGIPDAVALTDNQQPLPLVDVISYGGITGAPYSEGNGAPQDTSAPNVGISRFPDGIDTNDNGSDVSPRCATRGLANTSATTNCPPVPVEIQSFVVE